MRESIVIKFNKEFVKGNQYININDYNGKAFQDNTPMFYWQSRDVFNLLISIVEYIELNCKVKLTDKQLYGKGSIIDRLVPYQRQYNEFHTQPKLQGVSTEQGLNTNNSISPSNFPTCYPMPFNNNLMNSSPNVNFNNNSQNVNELFNMNINNQNYFGKIIEMFFHEQEKILESYKETIEK